jgi:hypothetical protein
MGDGLAADLGIAPMNYTLRISAGLMAIAYALLIYLGIQTYFDHKRFQEWDTKFDVWVACNHGAHLMVDCANLRPM